VEDVEKVVRFLDEEGLPFTPEVVGKVVKERNLEVEEAPHDSTSKAIVYEVINEGIKRSMGVTGKFLDLLGVPFPFRAELSYNIEERLSWGREVQVRCFSRKGEFHLEMRAEGWILKTAMKQSFQPPDPKLLRAIKEVGLDIQPGRVVLRSPASLPDLIVAKERAFFKAKIYEPKDLEQLKKTSRKAKTLAPLLSLMGVEDLSEAIKALEGLKEGEIRVEGPYLLARGERSLDLRRGVIFGDPELDGALLLERDLNLTFPDSVEVSFRPLWSSGHVSLHGVKIRWKDEVFRGEDGFLADSLLKDPITEAIRKGLQKEFERLESRPSSSSLGNASPRMLAFLRAFVAHENSLQALAEGRLHRYATAELFADF
jgi:hypothetical protein